MKIVCNLTFIQIKIKNYILYYFLNHSLKFCKLLCTINFTLNRIFCSVHCCKKWNYALFGSINNSFTGILKRFRYIMENGKKILWGVFERVYIISNIIHLWSVKHIFCIIRFCKAFIFHLKVHVKEFCYIIVYRKKLFAAYFYYIH